MESQKKKDDDDWKEGGQGGAGDVPEMESCWTAFAFSTCPKIPSSRMMMIRMMPIVSKILMQKITMQAMDS